MSTIGTALYRYLARTFGGVDWEQGSVVRELVAEPIVRLSDAAAAAVNAEYNKLNLTTLLEDPTAHSTEIDELFTELGLSSPTPTQSSGSVRLLFSTYADVVLAAGTVFSYDVVNLRTTAQYKLTMFPVNVGDIQLRQVGIEAYEAVVPVVSDATGVSLGAGAILTWSGISGNLYEATVASAITGGVGAYTAVQKINLIRQQLFPVGLTCADGLLRGLNYIVPNSVVDCLFAEHSTGGRISLFVKTTGAPETWTINSTSKQLVGSAQQVTIPSSGIDHIVSLNGTPGTESSIKITKQPRQWVIEYQGSTAATESVEIVVYGLRQMPALQQALDSFTQGTGLTFDLCVPLLLDCAVYLPIDATSVPVTTTNDIVNGINGTALNTTLVGDVLVRPLVTAAGLSMTGTGTYTLTQAATGDARSTTTASDPVPFVTNARPYAIYGYLNDITFNG